MTSRHGFNRRCGGDFIEGDRHAQPGSQKQWFGRRKTSGERRDSGRAALPRRRAATRFGRQEEVRPLCGTRQGGGVSGDVVESEKYYHICRPLPAVDEGQAA
jgi:hypothetical protein